MSDLERYLTVVSLSTAVVFYVFTVLIFLTARKNRVNYSLAIQKAIWLSIIIVIAIPAYAQLDYQAPSYVRVTLWSSLSVTSWLVMYFVYRANWRGTLAGFLAHLARESGYVAQDIYHWFTNCLFRGRCRIKRRKP